MAINTPMTTIRAQVKCMVLRKSGFDQQGHKQNYNTLFRTTAM